MLAPVLFVLAVMMALYILSPDTLPEAFRGALDAIFYGGSSANRHGTGAGTTTPETPPTAALAVPLPPPCSPPIPLSPALPPPPPPSPSPPPPAPLPVAPPPRPVVDILNERFRLGMPNDDPNLAGVVVHQFDGQEDFAQPWMPCTPQSENDWCSMYSDRFASSLINRRTPYLFNTAGGLVLKMSSDGVNRIFCAMSGDGGTMSIVCEPRGASDYCLPGCWSCLDEDGNAPDGVCEPSWCTVERPWQCGWRPTELSNMMQQQEHDLENSVCQIDNKCYNEILVDTATYVANLPHSLEAIFYLSTSSSQDEQHARLVHSTFLAATGMTPSAVPLLRLALNNHAAPFACVAC